MSNLTEFQKRYGPWAVVTGASSGIGRAIAGELALRGLNLVLVARRRDELLALGAELKAKAPIEIQIIASDLATSSGLDEVFAGTKDLDVGLLVGAAGFGTSGELLEADLADEVSMLNVNCRAVLAQAMHFGPRLKMRGRGGIVLFGSLVGFQGVPRAAHYAATKAYVQSLGEALHREWKAHGVDVLVSAPGPVHSGFGERARMALGMGDNPAVVARDTINALGRQMTATPGWVGKFLTWSLMTAPRGLRVRIMEGIMAGMTKSQSH